MAASSIKFTSLAPASLEENRNSLDISVEPREVPTAYPAGPFQPGVEFAHSKFDGAHLLL
jgi:hypothetical protein